MNVAREMFEEDRYPERFPEFKRLMAYCDSNGLRMSFFDEPPFIGIVVFDRDDNPIRNYSEYTLYYHTMHRKVYFLDSEDWDEGMSMLDERVAKGDLGSDEELIGSLGIQISN
jgi:hypothetical protein